MSYKDRKTDNDKQFYVKVLQNSIKFYLPRVEGYLEIVRKIASDFGAMSLIEFDGYFDGKFEPVKYTRVEVHTNDIEEKNIIDLANQIRILLKQKSLALEFNNRLFLVNESKVYADSQD
ncbi:MAG TPA: hypothetical protein VE089_01560 [Nitrososphaeraceae archaeon]|jgi:hypothetical protein|nr:hypothetical protein [Nitrososphaeraceae archaeon]